MYPTSETRREADKTSGTSLSSATHVRSNISNTTPSKRKAHDSHERAPLGKLPKPSKSARTVPVLAQQRDTYSIPDTPPAFSNPVNSSLERRRETTQDTDATYMPRGVTADTETIVGDEEIHSREVGRSSDPRKDQAFELT